MATIRETRQVTLDEIQPHPENYNHGDAGAISLSLKHHGQYRAIVVSEATGNILAGNHTYMAAKMNGETEMLAHLIPGLTPEDEIRIMIADNQYARLAYVDSEQLVDLLKELEASDVGLIATGYDVDALDELMADLDTDSFNEGREGNLGEYPEHPHSKLGDSWKLGDHILVCGDATDPDSYRHMPAQSCLVWTDPPYGVSLQERNKDLAARMNQGKNVAPVIGDKLDKEGMNSLWKDAFTEARAVSTDNASIYICAPGGPDGYAISNAAVESKWDIRHLLVWVKSSLVFGRADYHYRHEIIIYGWNKKHTWYGDNAQTTVFEVQKPSAHKLHPTSKPTPLIEPMLINSSPKGGWVLDPFAGSGSTLIACDNTGRKCYTIELDPGYCDVIIARWESLRPGNKAQLQGDPIDTSNPKGTDG